MPDNPFQKKGNSEAPAGREDRRSEQLKAATDICPFLTTPALQFTEVPREVLIQTRQRDPGPVPVLSMSLNFCIRESCSQWSETDGGGCSIKRGMEALYQMGKNKTIVGA